MYKPQPVIKNIFTGCKNAFKDAVRNFSEPSEASIKLDKILVVSKLTRFEYEETKYRHLSRDAFEKRLRSGGIGYDNLLYYHKLHKKFETEFLHCLKKLGYKYEVVNRFNYTDDHVNWADVIMPIGGDGTFLLAASKVLDNKKPVIGFNSDPRRSEGHLCVPKKYSTDIMGALERLRSGRFDWLYRSRIRTKIIKHEGEIKCRSLHDIDFCSDNKLSRLQEGSLEKGTVKVLPVLALNEVFAGENFAARVSNLKIRLDGSSFQAYVKCSGICVSTGTGSTSWHLSINRLSKQDARDFLKLIDIYPAEGGTNLAKILSKIYNKNIVFRPDADYMAYTIRDKIVSVVWPRPRNIKTRGNVKKIEIQSSCYDACLVVDGGVSFDFNDGTLAILEIHPDDALKTPILKD